MTGTALETTPLKDIVLRDFRAGAVLERYQLDYCCGGGLTLGEACRQRGVHVAQVIAELEALNPSSRETPTDAPIALIAHIVDRHHAYVRESLPTIQQHLAKVVAVHGTHHSELASIEAEFSRLATELSQHLIKEERVLFPYISSLEQAVHHGGPYPPDMFGTVQNPIRMMEIEHQEAGDGMAIIRRLSHDYEVPADACTTYRLLYDELVAFERDLHTHVHLENNVLFPAAIELEEKAELMARELKSQQWERHASNR
jgi:regulator of cell morphogenesis and NO signaling